MAVVDVLGMMGTDRSDGTHPFFHNRFIPHRAVKQAERSDNVETLSQPANFGHSNSRKRKSRPLVERPSNTHMPQLTTSSVPMDAKSAVPSTQEHNMDKTPKKKVLKLNSNGKLLSSPPVVPTVATAAETAVEMSPKATGKRNKARSSQTRCPSLIVKIGYGSEDSDQRLRVGSTISEVLRSDHKAHDSEKRSTPKNERTPKKATHPFFSGPPKPIASIAEGKDSKEGEELDLDASVSPTKSVSKPKSPQTKPAWKDITFSSKRSINQHTEAWPTPWPTADTQRVDGLWPSLDPHFSPKISLFQAYKSKGRASTEILADEDVLRRATYACFGGLRGSDIYTPRYPARKILSGEDMSRRLEDKLLLDSIHSATQTLRSSLSTKLTAFDQGKCDHSSWTTKSAPSRAEDVLQPGREAVVLRDWVKKLTVTSVGGGSHPMEKPQHSKPQARKRGRPKRSDDVDGFIVSSEDEADELTEIEQSTRESTPFIDDMKRSVLRTGAMTSSHDKGQAKNTILISGPTGCGKTASVYAVAKELGFEVFEIHPGTRRGAKDLLEKVGDMTQNHLVQHQSGEGSVEASPSTPIDDVVVQDEIASGKQRTMNGFFQTQARVAPKVGRKRKAVVQADQKEESSSKKPRKAQKQSLILLEEVDILFEEDKSFWSGVMSLISQSKRPIILTCNDESTLPLDELPLHGILRYLPPAEDMATDYLLTLAATEGHELDRDAVLYLYRSQKHDLRATINELDFWCQMGIGSRKGGLDWMLNSRTSSMDTEIDESRPRVFSTHTYRRGMGLTPQQLDMDPDQLVFDAYQQLEMPIGTWSADADRTFAGSPTVQEASFRADLYSDLDLCQRMPPATDATDLQLRIAISLTTRLSPSPPTQNDIVSAYVQPAVPPKLTRSTLTQVFEPLTNEKPTFPPSQGRLAPSLDSPTSTITSDIAPYARSIVASEQKWGASMAAPKRNTRASARPEGHFPKRINGKYVLMTGGEGWQDLWVRPEEDGGRDGEGYAHVDVDVADA
ncbi:hypothetical protein EPUS_06078 [Endocarpon pusillum Z07020]|uniref:AAA+ ATPase domain-containing protein n=1 Tax=Endocarpon pusillum (strain Z07020 / HMAS-L-300199) TaxID=1263415 RepID=U1G4S3_ENDPU|nr:uncharacterized protein EPUS_06078 [Endocarpon pusillum Z07020]ERF72322.1 hypothetical protein EPUS_06078 [Endocarpon pusillum Z07020]